MSKLTADLSNKKRVQDQIMQNNAKNTENLQKQYESLKHKMAEIEEKRNKKL